MALSLYIGPPGSGKSYEAVAAVMIPAFQAGRTIVTNIKGVDPEYWADNLEPVKGGKLGTIKVVGEDFFHTETNYPLMSKEGKNVEAGAIPDGALVVIDEAYMVFPSGADSGVTKRMIEYVRTHRHLVDDDGVASDIVMISQDVMSLHPRIRSVTEFCVAVRNMRYVGMGSRYRAVVFNNWKMPASSQLGLSVRKYKKSVFNYYKSFQAEGAAKVVLTDKSHKAFKWYHLLFVMCAIGLIIYGVMRARNTYSRLHSTTSETGTIGKPECQGSGVLVDLSDRRVLYRGQWRKIDAASAGPDGRTRWDVGPCFVTFSA